MKEKAYAADRLSSAVMGALSFQTLRAAYNVGLFELLHKTPGLTRDEIADGLGLASYPVEILLLALVPLELVQKREERYFNDETLSSVLAGKSNDGALGKFIDYMHHVVNPALVHLEESVRKNRPIGLQRLYGGEEKSFYAAIARDPTRNRYFEEAMRADTQFNRDRVAASDVFSKCHRILDVGGNTGELAIAITKIHPAAHVTIFDFPEVVADARKRIDALGLGDRIDTVSGNLLEEGFPRGFDCVVFSHFMDIFSTKDVEKFLAFARDCLVPGGKVCIFGSVMFDDETGPLSYGVLSSYFCCLANGEGRFRSAKQLADAMRGAGLVDVELKTLPKSEILVSASRP